MTARKRLLEEINLLESVIDDFQIEFLEAKEANHTKKAVELLANIGLHYCNLTEAQKSLAVLSRKEYLNYGTALVMVLVALVLSAIMVTLYLNSSYSLPH